MVSSVDLLLTRGERRAQSLRPATLTYGNVTVPCTPGNHDFFEVMAQNNAGRIKMDSQPVRLLRADLPEVFNNPSADIFTRGQAVVVHDLTTDQRVKLYIGQNNSWQSGVLTLMLESTTP